MAPQHGPVSYYGPNGANNNQGAYYGGAPQQTEAPPQYAHNTGNSNAGYYGNQTGYGQQSGVQQPQNVYAPPSGPPPNKY